jgi:hypothetical protein
MSGSNPSSPLKLPASALSHDVACSPAKKLRFTDKLQVQVFALSAILNSCGLILKSCHTLS